MENLKTSFGKLKVNQSQKTKKVQDVFSNVAKNYDLMNDLMSFGTHRLWKKKIIQLMNIQSGDQIIEVGSGTGDITNLINEGFCNISLTSIDLNLDMLKQRKNIPNNRNKINWINCNAENQPFKDNFFDKYIIAFCLRNITLIDKSIEEAFRILKPGGCFFCLEFSSPESPLINNLYNFYKKNIIPLIGYYVANNKEAYKYLEESITQFPHQEILSSNLNKLGFINTSVISLFNGIVSIHKAYKI